MVKAIVNLPLSDYLVHLRILGVFVSLSLSVIALHFVSRPFCFGRDVTAVRDCVLLLGLTLSHSPFCCILFPGVSMDKSSVVKKKVARSGCRHDTGQTV